MKPSLILLTLYLGIAAIGAMLITPALPAIAHYFHVSQGFAEWSIAIYILGYGIGQLFNGPLSNQYGRKTILSLGLIIGLLSTILGLVAIWLHYFDIFLLTRFIAAIGLSSGLVLSMAMIKDSFNEVEARKALSFVVMNFALVPFIAIAAGGVLTTHFGWICTQYLFIAIIIVALLFLVKLPETLKCEKRTVISFKKVMQGYLILFANSRFVLLMLIYCLAAAVSYIFNGLAPIIGIKIIGLLAQNYSFLSIITSVGFIFGAFLSNRLSHKCSAQTLIYYGLAIILFFSVAMLLSFFITPLRYMVLFAPAAFAFAGASIVAPNSSIKAMDVVTDHASGAAVLNCASLLLSSIVLSVLGHFILYYAFLLPLSIAVIGLLGLICISIFNKLNSFNK